jgi:hypothetical protein
MRRVYATNLLLQVSDVLPDRDPYSYETKQCKQSQICRKIKELLQDKIKENMPKAKLVRFQSKVKKIIQQQLSSKRKTAYLQSNHPLKLKLPRSVITVEKGRHLLPETISCKKSQIKLLNPNLTVVTKDYTQRIIN